MTSVSMRRNRGISLVEMLIVVLVLAIVASTLLLILRKGSQDIEFNEKHLTALMLGQKVTNDLYEELWINPAGLRIPGADPTSPAPTPVVRGQSVFFTHLENQTPPWRQMNPDREGRIDEKMPLLLSLVDDFSLRVAARREEPGVPVAAGNLLRGSVGFAWAGDRHRGHLQTDAIYFSPQTPKRLSPASLDGGAPETATDASQLGLPAGTAAPVFLSLAECRRLCRGFLDSDDYRRMNQRTRLLQRQIRAQPYPSEARYDAHMALANTQFDLARQALQALMAIEPTLTAFRAGYRGGIPPQQGSDIFRNILRDANLIYQVLHGSLLQARAHYQVLVTPEMAILRGVRQQYLLIMRLIDVYRVVAIMPTQPRGLGEYNGLLLELEDLARGRNPYLERFVANERRVSQRLQTLIDSQPNLRLLHDGVVSRLGPMLGFIRQEIVPPTGR